MEDELFWGLTPDGEYPVKSGVRSIQSEYNHHHSDVVYKWIWNLDLPPKVKNLLWKACNDGLPTKIRLERSHIFLPWQYVFCNFHYESATHLFFECPFSQDIYQTLQQVFSWPTLPSNFSVSQLSFRQSLNLCLQRCSKDSIQHLAMIWWFIWFFRNKIIFNNEAITFRKAAFAIHKFPKNWDNARRTVALPFVSKSLRSATICATTARSGKNLV